MSAQKLKSLKVADLRSILSKASVAAPARATKADLVTRILASEQALQAFHSLYPSDNVQQESSTTVSTATESPVATPSVTPQPPQPAPVAESATTGEVDKRKQRAERFGIPVAPAASPSPSNTHSVDPELEKRKKRAERFGIPFVGAPKPKQPDDGDKLKTRASRSGTAGQKRAAPGDAVDTDELERRKKRGERFGLVM
ncbi:hypothetical protein M378DRAFT_845205 [Amanita muscaria Koide BX008]|uniref:THO1-MOS11 C-terminal domain-containing protein n=1 Tax=Amanita muscaria (strain Koide BX008) TaxID=946122 RepID=A0A0C2XIZ9_AMAMK|nr:hypothetical protein M378DRAFT_845205 [Amanita muscaria Koide BX008]